MSAQIENLTLFPRIILLLDEIKLHATVISSSEMTETTTAQAPETVTAGATETEMSRERDGEEEEKIRRQKKLEEALEAKSLRRIMSAYLNYPEAAEEDLKKWERSYRKLSPAHKALVPHYALKFQRLRRCISTNSYFIFNMLQSFEPPIDLSQDLDGYEDSNLDFAPHEKYILDERHDSSCQPTLTNNSTHEEESKSMHDSELQKKDTNDPPPKNHSDDARNNDERYDCDGDHLNHDHGNAHDWLDPSLQTHVPLVDVDKVRCIIRNIVRDWAAEGQRERDQCYKPILDELDSLFPDRQKKRYTVLCLSSAYRVNYVICSTPPSCLVPGAGLGRLALEISCLGFISQGNEFSYYMMICSMHKCLMNGRYTPGYTVTATRSPTMINYGPFLFLIFILQGITEGFSMCGGDFVEVYNESCQAGMWDAVVTCFFIDTAHNIIEYIETISKILKDGGKDRTIETTYTTNPRSMMQNRYYAAFWTMRKKCAITT
ncbi:hypothetical protein HID58_062733 [Brassica napus]|uniref:Uncharacterized protein n=1 Tax=Brassica napus TaxID=3708 RepID=A0ABQ8A271_BRANA|nr:hypothetical protein HID58_062733 [Brassica napus]